MLILQQYTRNASHVALVHTPDQGAGSAEHPPNSKMSPSGLIKVRCCCQITRPSRDK
eukprot:COSAG05_NODE_535_length_8871_cov_311.345759_9_plen_57_part_00